MTFDEAHRAIKKGDLARLRKELDDGLNPNLANRRFWTLLMLAAIEGNTKIGELLSKRVLIWTVEASFVKQPCRLRLTPVILPSPNSYWSAAPLWNATHSGIAWKCG